MGRHIVIIDVITDVPVRIISLYRSFRPRGGISPETHFNAQLGVLKGAVTKNCFVMGDFNLDVKMELRNDYIYKSPFKLLTDFTSLKNLTQLIHFPTWTRTINGIKKESILDHVYTDNVALVNDITFTVPTFGDHKLVIAKLTPKANLNCESIFKRNWKNYSPNNLIENITLPPLTGGDVQAIWNSLEHSLIIAADYVAPLILVNNNLKPKKNKIPAPL